MIILILRVYLISSLFRCIEKMVQNSQNQIDCALISMLNEVDKVNLRRFQEEMYKCAAKCCKNKESSIEVVHACIITCSQNLKKAQKVVKNEFFLLQKHLQGCTLTCNNKTKEVLSKVPYSEQIQMYSPTFNNCVDKCINSDIALVSMIIKKMKEIWLHKAPDGSNVWCQRTPLQLNPEGLEFVKHVNESFYINCFHENASDVWWYRNGKAISEAFTRVYVERGNTFFSNGAALVFTNIQSNDKGNYTCKAKINDRVESLSFLLITYRSITFRDTPSVQNLGEFETGVIRCDADGEPEPTISWFVNGTPAESNMRYKPIGDGLLIANVTLEDAKKDFVCRAAAVNNITSYIELKNIRINVLYSPKLKGSSKTELYGYVGGEINATCEVDSNPAANFTWFRNNTRFFGEVNSTIFYEKNKSILRMSCVNTSILGEYRCRATNERGSIDRIFHVKEFRRPEPPKKAKVHSTSHNSLQLEIHAPLSREHEVTGYKVQIMEKREKEAGKNWEVAREVVLPKGKPFIINDLKPNTEYVVRVTSQNEAGSGEFAHEIKTKTLSSSSGSLNSLSSPALVLFFFSLTYKYFGLLTNMTAVHFFRR